MSSPTRQSPFGFQQKSDIKTIKATLSDKYGPKFDKVIDSEILNAINRMQGSMTKAKGSPSVRKGLSL